MKSVLGLILGGGRGTRLYPLTQKRSKPAVPIAGKYRLIDIPISNCLNAGIDKIAILTQFRSASLHRHITQTYQRDIFTDGWVEILAAEQTLDNSDWYQGTADAVRQQWVEITHARTKYVLVLAGDHLYRMDYSKFVEYHIETGADITLAVQPVSARDASGFGILKRGEDGQIQSFTEKPKGAALNGWESLPDPEKPYLASMGIYVFSTEMLGELLDMPGDDFGNDIIPGAIGNRKVMGFVYDGYWADIGTIRRFYEVNLELVAPDRRFDFSDPDHPIYTHPRFLPPSEIRASTLDRVLVADGCQILNSTITNAVVGLRSVIEPDVTIRDSVLMGADYCETEEQLARNKALGRPNVGIGAGSTIEGALIDKNARIGRNVHIRQIPDRPDGETEHWVVQDGLIIIPKSAIIPDNTVI
ncbi:MAG: glucose-1-phosphate adenylyltransferase [Anaerolineae bacterium]|nr:glucose-1-phosphate adenylyltransferase [Anaerolineae bacterium]